MTQTETRYIPVAETAKIVRTALKEAFPGIKFSVTSKSYSMGASIRVKWMDGPTSDEVEAVTRKFQGASFDSSTDLKNYHDGELNGESVHFGAGYVNCDRLLSKSFLAKVASWYCKRFGYQMPVIRVSTYDNSALIDGDYYVPQANEWLGTLLYREYRQISEKDVDDIDAKYAREEAEKEAAYQAYLTEKATQRQEEIQGKTLVAILEEVAENQARVRVLPMGQQTSLRLTIDGEIALYLKRYQAVLVSAEEFEMALETRQAA